MERIKELKTTPITPEEVVPDLLSIRKIKRRDVNKAPVRCTQQYGSMEEKKNLEQVEHLEEEHTEKENRKKEKEKGKEDNLARFY